MVANNEKKGDYYVNPCLSNWELNFNSKNGWKRCFLSKPKTQYNLSQLAECFDGTQSWMEGRLLCESEFIQLKIKVQF